MTTSRSEGLDRADAGGVIIDRDSPIPLYFQIAQQLERAIDSGEFAPGSRLDNEIELADRMAVSRPTLRKAIERLVDQGLLVRRRGLGTIVVPRRVRRPIALTSLYDDLETAGRTPSTQVLSLEEEPASAHVASMLAVDEGVPVFVVERLRLADGEPLALMHNWLPTRISPVTAEGLARQGLYQLLRRHGIVPQLAHQVVGARQATTREARLLGIPRGATVLTMQRTTYDSSGQPVEYGAHAYVAERYSFEMSLVAR
jgi:DNA-binding GntR family transcriptional regulator